MVSDLEIRIQLRSYHRVIASNLDLQRIRKSRMTKKKKKKKN